MTDLRLGQTRQAPATASEHGLLGAWGGPESDFRLDRAPAAAEVSDLVERHWLVSWSLPPGRRGVATLLPHPCVNLVVDRGAVAVAGVGTARFTYPYEGAGRVFGVKFRPGAFRPFLGRPVAELTDRSIPLAALWGSDRAGALARDLDRATDLAELAAVAERHLRAHWPEPDPEVFRVGRIVHALLHDRSITRVDDVARRFGLSPRSLQRLFHRYVGVSPKWVLSRYRLHEAAARLAASPDAVWVDVAADLGFFDQSHFIRDFTRAVGMTPTAYAEACARRTAPVRT